MVQSLAKHPKPPSNELAYGIWTVVFQSTIPSDTYSFVKTHLIARVATSALGDSVAADCMTPIACKDRRGVAVEAFGFGIESGAGELDSEIYQ